MTNNKARSISYKSFFVVIAIVALILPGIYWQQKKAVETGLVNRAAKLEIEMETRKVRTVDAVLARFDGNRADQINCFQQVTELFPAYKIRISNGSLSSDTTFQSYFNTQKLAEIYLDLEISVCDLPDNDIEALAREPISQRLVIYDTLKGPGVDWYEGCGLTEPRLIGNNH